jgi:DNA topoisomerase-3
MLLRVERGEVSGDAFMDGIAAMVTENVKANNAPKPEFAGLFVSKEYKKGGPVLGVCPRCGSSVREGGRGFFCDARDCGFKIWKDNRFFAAKRKAPTAALVTALLKYGKYAMTGLYSEKTGKTYDAVVVMDDTGQYVNFKLDFGKGGAKR